MEEALRESILTKLNVLQGEIDRNRTQLAVLSEAWLAATEAAGKGAKNLEPAFKWLEKLGGAFSWLKKTQDQEEPRQLPPPERLGLPDVRDDPEPPPSE
jgi:hypothetical protein